MTVPRILALGGSTSPGSASERVLRMTADACRARGADVDILAGRDLILPLYDLESSAAERSAHVVVDALRACDGLLVASPGYHGALSGLVKNALDYAEELRLDDRPYLSGRAVGLIAVAHGWQTAVATLGQLRTVVHALRGWPTPLGVAVNDAAGVIGTDLGSTDPALAEQVVTMAEQVVAFARMSAATPGR